MNLRILYLNLVRLTESPGDQCTTCLDGFPLIFFSNKSLKKSFSGILRKQAKTDEPVDSKYSTLEGLQ